MAWKPDEFGEWVRVAAPAILLALLVAVVLWPGDFDLSKGTLVAGLFTTSLVTVASSKKDKKEPDEPGSSDRSGRNRSESGGDAEEAPDEAVGVDHQSPRRHLPRLRLHLPAFR